MRNAITKIIAHPLGLYILAALMANVNYTSVYEIITVGIILAAVAYGFDALFLRNISYSTNAIIKGVIIGFLVWLSQFVFVGSFVSIWGAVAVGIVLGIVEYAIIRFATSDDVAHTPSQ